MAHQHASPPQHAAVKALPDTAFMSKSDTLLEADSGAGEVRELKTSSRSTTRREVVARILTGCCAGVLAVACGGHGPTAPSRTDLTGTWIGTSTYPNAPFELRLTHTGGTLRGDYKDRHDTSLGVTGTFSTGTVGLVVDFGDAKLNLDGSVVDARTVQGTMHTSALGTTRFPFTMTR